MNPEVQAALATNPLLAKALEQLGTITMCIEQICRTEPDNSARDMVVEYLTAAAKRALERGCVKPDYVELFLSSSMAAAERSGV